MSKSCLSRVWSVYIRLFPHVVSQVSFLLWFLLWCTLSALWLYVLIQNKWNAPLSVEVFVESVNTLPALLAYVTHYSAHFQPKYNLLQFTIPTRGTSVAFLDVICQDISTGDQLNSTNAPSFAYEKFSGSWSFCVPAKEGRPLYQPIAEDRGTGASAHYLPFQDPNFFPFQLTTVIDNLCIHHINFINRTLLAQDQIALAKTFGIDLLVSRQQQDDMSNTFHFNYTQLLLNNTFVSEVDTARLTSVTSTSAGLLNEPSLAVSLPQPSQLLAGFEFITMPETLDRTQLDNWQILLSSASISLQPNKYNRITWTATKTIDSHNRASLASSIKTFSSLPLNLAQKFAILQALAQYLQKLDPITARKVTQLLADPHIEPIIFDNCLSPETLSISAVKYYSSYDFFAFLSDLGGFIQITFVVFAIIFPFVIQRDQARAFLPLHLARKCSEQQTQSTTTDPNNSTSGQAIQMQTVTTEWVEEGNADKLSSPSSLQSAQQQIVTAEV